MSQTSLGHSTAVSLLPISAISAMVSPAVLITIAGVFAAGLQATYNAIASRVIGLNRERLGILCGPHGELLDEASVPAADRERLTQIRNQMPLILRRVRRIRDAAMLAYCAITLLVSGVISIAVAETAHSEAFAFIAMSLVLAGTITELAGFTSMILMLVGSLDALIYEARRTDELG